MPMPKGHKHTPESREKMRLTHLKLGTKPPSWLGKRHSEETKRKIGASQPQKTAAQIQDLVSRNKDPHFWTEERRRKLSKSLKRRPLNVEALEITHFKNIGKKRTPEQKMNISLALRGPKSSFWKGGLTKENQRIRSSAEFTRWRKDVFERDNYTCKACFVRGGYLEAHHIKPFATHHDLRFVVSNGITLCLKCHRQQHNEARS